MTVATFLPPVLLPGSPNPDEQRYGLFKVATGPLTLEPHARGGGLQYQTALEQLPHGYATTCGPDNITFNGTLDIVTGTPFLVVSDVSCGVLGHTEAEWQTYVMDRLTAGEQAVVENVFSQGLFGQSPSLANNPDAVTLPAALTISAGIDALEAWLYARYGPTGVLHIPIQANSAVFADYHILKDTDGILRTPMGTKVSFGNYANLLPNGTAPTTGDVVFYITGQVALWRSDDAFVSPYGASINKATNQIHMFAEREYVVAFEGPSGAEVAGIEVTLGNP
jgi:hypothetical protein